VKGQEKQEGRETQRSLEPDQELVFYYNRERRLEKASPGVRAVNEGRPLIKGGFIRSLTSTKPHTILLVTIAMIVVWILAFSALSGSRDRVTLGGNTLQISAGAEPFIVVIKRAAPDSEEPYTGMVSVGVSPYIKSAGKISPSDIPVFTDQLFFTLDDEEEYRLDLPFRAEQYLLLFQAGEQRAYTRVKAGK
jgi:hypothetical protein